jgi:hypothetical protein
MPEKCYPCTRTNLLPMYLDYTQGGLTYATERAYRVAYRCASERRAPADTERYTLAYEMR